MRLVQFHIQINVDEETKLQFFECVLNTDLSVKDTKLKMNYLNKLSNQILSKLPGTLRQLIWFRARCPKDQNTTLDRIRFIDAFI